GANWHLLNPIPRANQDKSEWRRIPMDVMETVREIAPSEQPTEHSIHFARARLAQEISAQNASSNTSRKRLYWAGGLTAAAAAVTAGVLIVANILPGNSTNTPSMPPPPP